MSDEDDTTEAAMMAVLASELMAAYDRRQFWTDVARRAVAFQEEAAAVHGHPECRHPIVCDSATCIAGRTSTRAHGHGEVCKRPRGHFGACSETPAVLRASP